MEALLSHGVLRAADIVLDGARADRCAELRLLGGGSVVDAVVAQAAEELSDEAKVTVLTADLTDLPRLIAATRRPTEVRVQRV